MALCSSFSSDGLRFTSEIAQLIPSITPLDHESPLDLILRLDALILKLQASPFSDLGHIRPLPIVLNVLAHWPTLIPVITAVQLHISDNALPTHSYDSVVSHITAFWVLFG